MSRILTTILALSLATVALAGHDNNDIFNSELKVEAVELTPNEARARRGFTTNTLFVPKGQWIFGGIASYSAHRNQDYRFVVINDINSEGYSVNVSPMIAYAPWQNMAVGLRFGYERTMLHIDGASLSIGDGESGIGIDVDYVHQLKHSFTGSLFWRPYIPLGQGNRFAIFTELQLNFSGGQSRLVALDGQVDVYPDYRGTYAKNFACSIALQPGIVAFVTNNTALELSIGVFGVGYEHTRQIKNQVEEGLFRSSNMNFKVNLLSIGFGVSFYL